MKKILSASLALFLAALAPRLPAATLSATSFEEACRVLKAEKITTGDFIQKRVISQTGRTLKSSGIFTVSPQGIIWQSLKPVKSTTEITPEKITQIDSRGNKNTLSSADNQIFSLISKMTASLFSGNGSDLEEFFEVSFKAGASSDWEMTLKAKDSTVSQAMDAIILTGNSEVLLTMKNLQKNGDYLLYEFYNHKFSEE